MFKLGSQLAPRSSACKHAGRFLAWSKGGVLAERDLHRRPPVGWTMRARADGVGQPVTTRAESRRRLWRLRAGIFALTKVRLDSVGVDRLRGGSAMASAGAHHPLPRLGASGGQDTPSGVMAAVAAGMPAAFVPFFVIAAAGFDASENVALLLTSPVRETASLHHLRPSARPSSSCSSASPSSTRSVVSRFGSERVASSRADRVMPPLRFCRIMSL